MLTVKGQRNNNRRNPGIAGRRPDKHAARVEVAARNLDAWSKLTTQEKIYSLDRRLGTNVGAVKQRAKLAQLIVSENVRYEKEKAKVDNKLTKQNKQKT
jgi:hypothetical protein